jgi:nicotinamidase-related amidase
MLLIDCQNDFCSPDGNLFVQGADQDMKRLSNLIGKMGDKISGFHVSLDSHNPFQIFFSAFWQDRMGNHPLPYTKITAEDVAKGVWQTVNPQDHFKALKYVQILEANSKHELIIWPKHTIKGTSGHALFPDISNALINWSETTMGEVNFYCKGDNKFTEMYSIFKAEVPDPTDPSTMLNSGLITNIIADEVLIAGEALSHCVMASVDDLIDAVPTLANRFVLLEDCCSNVGGFEKYGNEFIDRIIKRGVRVMKSTDYLKAA